jgi:hypothetical protein
MRKNRGLTCLILSAFSISVIGAGCAGVPPRPPQAYAAAKNPSPSTDSSDDSDSGWLFRSLTGRGAKGNEKPQPPAQTTPNPAAPNPSYPQGVVQTSALIPGPSAGIPTPSAVTGTVASEAIGEDDSGSFPLSVLPPQPPVTTAPPKLLPDPPPTPASMADPMKDKDLDFWSKLAPENVWKSVKKATGNGPNEGIARAAFKDGQELFKQKKFTEAAEKFKIAADRWPDTPLE